MSPGEIWDLLLAINKDYKTEAPFLFYLWDMTEKNMGEGAKAEFLVVITNLPSIMDPA